MQSVMAESFELYRDTWKLEEDQILLSLHEQLGNDSGKSAEILQRRINICEESMDGQFDQIQNGEHQVHTDHSG